MWPATTARRAPFHRGSQLTSQFESEGSPSVTSGRAHPMDQHDHAGSGRDALVPWFKPLHSARAFRCAPELRCAVEPDQATVKQSLPAGKCQSLVPLDHRECHSSTEATSIRRVWASAWGHDINPHPGCARPEVTHQATGRCASPGSTGHGWALDVPGVAQAATCERLALLGAIG